MDCHFSFHTTDDFLKAGGQLRFVGARQTHSCNIAVVGTVSEDLIDDCDALITNRAGIALYIKTADCVPILLHDKKKGVVAAVHAGWRGTAGRIVEQTIKRMVNEFSTKPSDIEAIIGPCIHSCCFEVGQEVVEQIGESFIVSISPNGRPMLSLTDANIAQMCGAGVNKDSIEVDPRCTCCTNNLHSYRRNQTAERNYSVVWL